MGLVGESVGDTSGEDLAIGLPTPPPPFPFCCWALLDCWPFGKYGRWLGGSCPIVYVPGIGESKESVFGIIFCCFCTKNRWEVKNLCHFWVPKKANENILGLLAHMRTIQACYTLRQYSNKQVAVTTIWHGIYFLFGTASTCIQNTY
jgi:hypothetical protein